MEVKIISKQLIRPSSSTPQHLRTFKLSLFDQKYQNDYGPVILFYRHKNSEPGLPALDLPEKVELLKKSLSHTLARLYPLAGKILVDSVECDDEGALFVEAAVNMTLTQVLTDPDTGLFVNFFPFNWGSHHMTRTTNIQVNVFECGGIAIGLCISHVLCDGTTLAMFLKEWAAAAKSGAATGLHAAASAPGLGLAGDLFPATADRWMSDLLTNSVTAAVKSGNSNIKRFLFSGVAIEALRARGASPSNKNPSRVEAVSGFLWKCMMAAASRKRNDDQRRPSSFTHVVNIRRRTNPFLPESCLGDLTWMTTSHLENSDSQSPDEITLPVLMGKLRGAISKVDSEFLSQLKFDKDLISRSIEEACGLRSSPKDKVDVTFCTSWCNIGFHDSDFGCDWGTPIWVGTATERSSVFFNSIVLVDTKYEGGIEAWVSMDDQEMALLEVDGELLSFASVNPSPLVFYNKELSSKI